MKKVKSQKSKGKVRRLCDSSSSYFCLLTFYFCLTIAFLLSAPSVNAQTRDYFTDEEIELIRDAQQIDNRIELLTKIIDRRFAVLKIEVGGAKPQQGKDWGALPTGTRTELFSDIKNILQKAIDDIDNLADRPDSMVIDPDDEKDKKKKKDYAGLFPKAVRTLAKAAERYKPALKTALDATKDEREKGLLLDSIDMCDEIIAAVTKLK